MKIRTDFVTNSSSSSFVCVQFKSNKLKELLNKYDVQYWDSDDEWDVSYEDEDLTCMASSQDSIKGVVDYFIKELLPIMNTNNDYINEYIANERTYLDDIEGVYYSIDSKYWDEFSDHEDYFDEFEYSKGKTSELSDRDLRKCLDALKEYNLENFRLGDLEEGKYIPGAGTRYAGKLHQLLATDDSEIILVRDPNNEDDPNAIFVEERPHRYMGMLWHGVTEYLAPLLDSGKYLYKAKFDNETRKFSIDVIDARIQEEGWHQIETGSPQLSEEETESIRKSFDQWLKRLKENYIGRKLPKSVNTLLKNGDEDPGIVKEWARVLFNKDLEILLAEESLLDIGSKSAEDATKWAQCDESRDDYENRIWNSILERLQNVTDLDCNGKTFALCTGTLWTGNRDGIYQSTDSDNPVVVAITQAGGIVKRVSGKTNYVIVETNSGKKHSIGECVKVLKEIDKGKEIKIITLENLKELIELPIQVYPY